MCCVDFILNVAAVENSQNYAPMLMVIIVTSQDFIEKY
jgi:hypothetical protein